jgi:SsrA-binding protein
LSKDDGRKMVARNRKARHEFEILETVEAGMELRGPEVKSMRAGQISFQDSFARVERGEMWLHSLHISPYKQANRANVDPVRTRRLLLSRKEIRHLAAKVDEKGLTLVPLDIYFSRGYAKLTLGVARGRKLHDKREALKRREQDREARRAMEER